MELQNTLRDLFIARRHPNTRLGAVENNIRNEPQEVVAIIEPECVPAPAPEEEEEEEACSVCLSPMDTKHTLQCGHTICGDCPAMMMTQHIGNGCVGLHAETGIKVIKCPICRKEDMPTREELIAEIVRIRRGGNFVRAYPPAPAPAPRAVAHAHNLPAVIPVLQPVIQHANAPPPPPAVAVRASDWLMTRNYQPIRTNGVNNNHELNHWQQYTPLHFHGDNLDRWNIMRGHPIIVVHEVGAFLHAGISQNHGKVCGQGVNRRYYHQQFFIPNDTEGNVPARRLCNNNGTCATQQRSRTARRCSRGCGQFICQGCGVCNNERCIDCN